MDFKGFPSEMLAFLRENREKNSREWYDSHKPEYKRLVYAPFASFVETLAPTAAFIDPLIVTQPRYCLCHIYRDTRFTKDKSHLYRDNMWITFKRPAKVYPDSPAFYFEVTQSGAFWGMGYWASSAANMALYRRYILEYPDLFKKRVSKIKTLHWQVEHYKKKFREQPAKGLEEYFTVRNIHVCDHAPVEEIYDGAIVEKVRNGMKEAAELYKLMNEIKLMPELVEDRTTSIPTNNIGAFEW